MRAREAGLLSALPQQITGYIAMTTEPDVSEILREHWNEGSTVFLPRVTGQDLEWIPTSANTPLAPGPFGLREPVGVSRVVDWTNITVMFLPALAIDRTGHRLGQGGGFYDRALASVPSVSDGGPLRVGVVHDEEFLESVPVDDHDRGVDAVLTERQFVRFTPTEG
jgi:5-formyltetrahydrofolate cyclo-ligase